MTINNLMEKRKKQNNIKSMYDMYTDGEVKNVVDRSLFIHGPDNFDCLINKWAKTQVYGIMGDSGTGKSETVLTFMPSILESNPDEIVVGVNLEMTNQDVFERIYKICRGERELIERFYSVSRYKDDGTTNDVSMEWIKREVKRVKDVTGKAVSALYVDHIHCLGENDPSTLNSIMISLKEMAVELNCAVFALAQVNKSSSGKGELPLDADAVLGCSQFKYIATDIIQIHRPILRLEEEAGLNVLSWGYCKVRKPHKDDPVKRGQNKLLIYESDNCTFRPLTVDEYFTFTHYYSTLLEMRSAEEKKKAFSYDIQKKVVRPDGSEVILKSKFSGGGEEI